MAQLYMERSPYAKKGKLLGHGSISFYANKLRNGPNREAMLTEARGMALDGLQAAVQVKGANWSKQITILGNAKAICSNKGGELYYRNTKGVFPCRFFLDLDPCLPIDSGKDEVGPLQLLYDEYLTGLVSRVNDALQTIQAENKVTHTHTLTRPHTHTHTLARPHTHTRTHTGPCLR